MGTNGSLWSWCLTTGRSLDNSQGWRHLSLVRSGPPNQKVEPPRLTKPLPALSGCPSFHLGPISFAFGQEYVVSVGAGKTAAGAGSCRQAWLRPSREGNSDEEAAWPSSSHQMVLRRLPGPPPPCSGFYQDMTKVQERPVGCLGGSCQAGVLGHPESQALECMHVYREEKGDSLARSQVSVLSELSAPWLSREGDAASTTQKILQSP